MWRGRPGGREVAYRVGHGPAVWGERDLRHLPHPVQVPGLNGPLVARWGLCRRWLGKNEACEEANQQGEDDGCLAAARETW